MSALATVISRRPFNVNKRRIFACGECTSAFGSRMELEEHTNSHTGRKPFVCKTCKASFNRRSTLWNHKRIHGNEKPFVCPVCFATFKWKNSLKCHGLGHAKKNEARLEQFDAAGQTFSSGKKRATKRSKEETEEEKEQQPQEDKQQQQPDRKRGRRNAYVDENDTYGKWRRNLLPGISSFMDAPEASVPAEDLVWAFGDRGFGDRSVFLFRSMTPLTQPSTCVVLPTVCLPADQYFTEGNPKDYDAFYFLL